MAQLHAVESDDPLVGGFTVEFPSGTKKVVSWRQSAVIHPALDAAKEFVSAVISAMLEAPGVTNDDRRIALDDIERTNVPSLVAAVHKIVRDWNGKRAEALHAENPEYQRLFKPQIVGPDGLPLSATVR